jgi:peptide/nickel transport system substrate-binding protein
MTISRRAALQGGLAAGALATGLPLATRAAAATDTGTLRAVMQGDLRVFDPIWTTANITAYYGVMVYDTLFANDEQFRPQPQMVGKQDLSEDKRTYTFELRDGLGWQDGTPVTAADCVASLHRWMARNGGGQVMQQFVKDISAKDDKTLVIALKEPFGLVTDLLASQITPLCFMMRKKDAETDPFQQVSTRIGSGPFLFNEKDTRPGSRYVFDKWTKYVPRQEAPNGLAGGKVVNLDQVIWDNISDEQTATAALQSGEIDFYELPPIDLLPQLQSDPNIKIDVLNKTGNVGIARLNCRTCSTRPISSRRRSATRNTTGPARPISVAARQCRPTPTPTGSSMASILTRPSSCSSRRAIAASRCSCWMPPTSPS